MGEQVVYSLKVNKEQLELAKKFLAREGGVLQDSLRDFIEVAADCEQCLELHEEDASIRELQSAFASLLAKCKDSWHLSDVMQESVMQIARLSKVPLDFITNVLFEARKGKPAHPHI